MQNLLVALTMAVAFTVAAVASQETRPFMRRHFRFDGRTLSNSQTNLPRSQRVARSFFGWFGKSNPTDEPSPAEESITTDEIPAEQFSTTGASTEVTFSEANILEETLPEQFISEETTAENANRITHGEKRLAKREATSNGVSPESTEVSVPDPWIFERYVGNIMEYIAAEQEGAVLPILAALLVLVRFLAGVIAFAPGLGDL